jgi:hypothetical protein
VAASLNRTLVPPPWMCWCDQDWVADILESCSMLGGLEKGGWAGCRAGRGVVPVKPVPLDRCWLLWVCQHDRVSAWG